MEVLRKCRKFAVLGLKDDKSKYVYKIYQRLLDEGYEVYGVSSYISELDGVKVYQSLFDLPFSIDMAVFVVSKNKGYEYLDECKVLNIPYLWFQPGTYDEDFIKKLEKMQVQYYLNCILRRLDDLEKNID